MVIYSWKTRFFFMKNAFRDDGCSIPMSDYHSDTQHRQDLVVFFNTRDSKPAMLDRSEGKLNSGCRRFILHQSIVN